MLTEQDASDAGRELSKLGAAKGGEARANKLSPERRREIALAAIQARWEKAGKPAVPIASFTGDLKIGDTIIPCAVLDDGTRVVTENGLTNALLGSRSGASKRLKRASVEQGAPLPLFIAPGNLKPFITKELLDGPLKPITYIQGDRKVSGFDATALPTVCEIWLRARADGRLQAQQADKAKQAEILMRGLARVGITALVDEATGYQDARARDALAKILEAFVAKELQPYLKRFQPEFYKQVYRLRGWAFPSEPKDQRRTPLIGKITNDLIYDRLAPGVRAELHRKTPRDEKGRLKHKLYKWLTPDVGDPKLGEHLAVVTGLMRGAKSWAQFKELIDRSLPRYGDTPYLPFEG